MPHDQFGDAADRRSAEDAAWREIVDNYGDRPELDEAAEHPDAGQGDSPDERATTEPAERPAAARIGPTTPPEPVEEHYVPPPAPPVPRAEPRRLLAWLGLFLSPTLVLVALVTRFPIPSWLGLLLMVWFVGGFVFLVASMRSEPRDEDDDGAVV